MRDFEELVAEAVAADVTGWGFDWLEGRASEQRPPWKFASLLSQRLGQVSSALDLDTGGGEVLSEAKAFPPLMVASEGWAPNAERARKLLEPRGVQVLEFDTATHHWPVPERSFELVSSRHPVAPNWEQIHRALRPEGSYLGQHVGPASAFELIEFFLGPLPVERQLRDPEEEQREAQDAGLKVVDLRTAKLRMEFFDVGAVVWILRKCVWWVPDFTVEKYWEKLLELDALMRGGQPFIAHSSRHLIEARRA